MEDCPKGSPFLYWNFNWILHFPEKVQQSFQGTNFYRKKIRQLLVVLQIILIGTSNKKNFLIDLISISQNFFIPFFNIESLSKKKL